MVMCVFRMHSSVTLGTHAQSHHSDNQYIHTACVPMCIIFVCACLECIVRSLRALTPNHTTATMRVHTHISIYIYIYIYIYIQNARDSRAVLACSYAQSHHSDDEYMHTYVNVDVFCVHVIHVHVSIRTHTHTFTHTYTRTERGRLARSSRVCWPRR
jgi:hypothetical protein